MKADVSSLIQRGMGLHILDNVSPYDYEPENGRLLIWEAPTKGETYAVGVDPAEGVKTDRSVACVLKVGNLIHGDEQVAEFACDFLDPVEFSNVVQTIGKLYCDDDGTEALCIVEINAPCGQTVVSDLHKRLDYGNLYIWKRYDKWKNIESNTLGWWTNPRTRPALIARGNHAMQYGDLVIHSPHLLNEMQDFKQDHFLAKAAARYGQHDDRVMALLIAYWGAHDDEWLAGEDIAEERRLRTLAGELQVEISPEKAKPDYQNSAMTFRQMMQDADERIFGD